MHIVHTESSLGWGGQELRILSEAEGMMARGHRLTLLCPEHSNLYKAAQARQIPVEALAIARKRPGGVVALRNWLLRNAVDVINTHSSTDSWLAALACKTLRTPPPLVRTRHISAPVPDNASTRWLYCSATRHIVTTGEALRQTLITRNCYPAENITSVPTGIDSVRFAPGDRAAARTALGLPAAASIVGIVATLRSWKGHRFLLEAVAQLARPEVCLVVVGDGPQRAALEQLAGELQLDGRIRFAGNQEDVRPWLHATDVFVLPSYANEGVPQALIQAMMCGLPVISTGIGGIPELVRDGATGLIVEPSRTEAIAARLAPLLDDPATRQRLGQAARAHAERNFGRDGMIERMEQIFRQAAASRPPKPA